MGLRRNRALLGFLTASFLVCTTVLLMREAHRNVPTDSGNAVRPDLQTWIASTSSISIGGDTSALSKRSSPFESIPLRDAVQQSSWLQSQETLPVDKTMSSSSSSSNGTTVREVTLPTQHTHNGSNNATTTSSPTDNIKVPFPIFIASLPKSGTTSAARYFYCGKIWTAHTFVNTQAGQQRRVGECFQQNMVASRPPFENCGKYHVYSDAGFVRGKRCFYPSVHGLRAFYDAYPNATIILIKRNSAAWLDSIKKWKKGALLKKWDACDEFPAKNATDAQYQRFYEWHADNIRQFAAKHPSLTYVEVQLESDRVHEQLQASIGINASCFGHHNSHEKRVRLNPKFRHLLNETTVGVAAK